jgi:hypothetical protein
MIFWDVSHAIHLTKLDFVKFEKCTKITQKDKEFNQFFFSKKCVCLYMTLGYKFKKQKKILLQYFRYLQTLTNLPVIW